MARAPFRDDIPEPDCAPGAPHPRFASTVFGHAAPEAAFLQAFNAGRLHHGWMITGPRGVGKATLAWKIARFLLATPEEDGGMFAPPPPGSLDIAPDHPITRRMQALGEPRLFLLRRGWNDKTEKLTEVLSVDEVRKMKNFFSLSAADGGRRVAIVDAVDEMNPAAANALLKLLEEPPAKVTLILIAHQPARLLPTIRSRCRELRLVPLAAEPLSDALVQAGADLDPADRVALAELAGGSVGEAFRLSGGDGLQVYRGIVAFMDSLPRLDRTRALALSELAAARGTDRFDLIVTLLDLFLARLARAGATRQLPPEAAPGEAALITRLCASEDAARAWAELAQSLGIRARRGKAVNLDPAALLMDMLLRLDEVANRLL